MIHIHQIQRDNTTAKLIIGRHISAGYRTLEMCNNPYCRHIFCLVTELSVCNHNPSCNLIQITLATGCNPPSAASTQCKLIKNTVFKYVKVIKLSEVAPKKKKEKDNPHITYNQSIHKSNTPGRSSLQL